MKKSIFILGIFVGIIISLAIFLSKEKERNFYTNSTQNLKKDNGWRDDFNKLDLDFWNIPDRQALEGEYRDVHLGFFEKDNVYIKNGFLILKLIQEKDKVGINPNGVITKGSELESKNIYGYGTYEWRMRVSTTSDDPKVVGNTVSGQISAGFNFINNSETEIDFEVEGQFPNQLEMVTWKNSDTSVFPSFDDRIYTFKTIPNLSTQFHTYKFVWTEDEIKYYLDGVLQANHKEHVPNAPAHFMINHWGTNSANFGGEASVGVERYVVVDWVSFSPL